MKKNHWGYCPPPAEAASWAAAASWASPLPCELGRSSGSGEVFCLFAFYCRRGRLSMLGRPSKASLCTEYFASSEPWWLWPRSPEAGKWTQLCSSWRDAVLSVFWDRWWVCLLTPYQATSWLGSLFLCTPPSKGCSGGDNRVDALKTWRQVPGV